MQPERSVGFLIDEVGTIEMVDVISVDETVDAVCGGYVQVLCLFVVLEEPVPSFTQIGKKDQSPTVCSRRRLSVRFP